MQTKDTGKLSFGTSRVCQCITIKEGIVTHKYSISIRNNYQLNKVAVEENQIIQISDKVKSLTA